MGRVKHAGLLAGAALVLCFVTAACSSSASPLGAAATSPASSTAANSTPAAHRATPTTSASVAVPQSGTTFAASQLAALPASISSYSNDKPWPTKACAILANLRAQAFPGRYGNWSGLGTGQDPRSSSCTVFIIHDGQAVDYHVDIWFGTDVTATQELFSQFGGTPMSGTTMPVTEAVIDHRQSAYASNGAWIVEVTAAEDQTNMAPVMEFAFGDAVGAET